MGSHSLSSPGAGLGAVPAAGLVVGGVFALEGAAALATSLIPLAGTPGTVALRLGFGPANPQDNLTVDREVCVERFVGVDDARSSLGRLVEQVAAGGDVVALTKRGKALAVLVSRDEYLQMKLVASERARAELAEALGSARRKVREAGLDAGVIDEAIAAARQL